MKLFVYALTILVDLMTSAVAIKVFQEKDFYLLEMKADLNPARRILHKLWGNLETVKREETFKSFLTPQVLSALESELVKWSRYLNSLLPEDSLSVDYIEKAKPESGDELQFDKYSEKTGRDSSDFQELHDLNSHSFDYGGALLEAMNQGNEIKRVKRNIIGDALEFMTGVAGPTEVAMDHKQFAAIELEQANLGNMTVSNVNDLQIIKKTINRQKSNFKELETMITKQTKGNEEQELKENEDASVMGYYITFRSELDKIGTELQRIAGAVAEAKAGFISKIILRRDELEEVAKEINSKSRDYTVVFPTERIDLLYKLRTAKVVFKKDYVFFYLRVPLINNEHSLTLHPMNAETKIRVGNRADFFLLSCSHPSYQTITYDELKKAIHIPDFGFITDHRSVEIDLKEDLNPNRVATEQWVFEDHRDHFIIQASEEHKYKVQVRCPDNRTTINLPPLAEVTLPEPCSLTSSWFIIDKMKQIGKTKISISERIKIKDLWNELEKTKVTKLQKSNNIRKKYEKQSGLLPRIYGGAMKINDAMLSKLKVENESTADLTEPRIEFSLVAVALIALIVGLLGRKVLKKLKWRSRRYQPDIELGTLGTQQVRVTEEPLEARFRELMNRVTQLEEKSQTWKNDYDLEISGIQNKMLIIEGNQQSMRAEYILREKHTN